MYLACHSDHHDEVEAKDTNDSIFKGYDLEDFRNAFEHVEHPDSEKLNMDMLGWQINDADLNDLMTYLKSL